MVEVTSHISQDMAAVVTMSDTLRLHFIREDTQSCCACSQVLVNVIT